MCDGVLEQMMAQYLVSQHLSQQLEQSQQHQQQQQQHAPVPSPVYEKTPLQHPYRAAPHLGEADLASMGMASLPAFQSVLAALAASHMSARQAPGPPLPLPPSHFDPVSLIDRLEMDRLSAAAPHGDAYGMEQVSELRLSMVFAELYWNPGLTSGRLWPGGSK